MPDGSHLNLYGIKLQLKYSLLIHVSANKTMIKFKIGTSFNLR